MPTSVILVSSYDPGYLIIFEHLVRVERAAGHEVLVLDTTGLQGTPFDSFHRGVLRATGLPVPGHDIEQRLTALGAEYRHPELDGTSVLPLDGDLESLLEISVQSALITFYRTDRPNRRRRSIRRVADALTSEGRAVYRAVRALTDEREIAQAYVPNGRFPHQKLAGLAFAAAGVPTRHIEKGEGANRAYVQDYAPQDRLKSQGAVETVLASMSSSEVDRIADAWLARRAPAADSRNEFSTLWRNEVPAAVEQLKRSGSPIVGFFTSSQDEFQFLGPEWQLHDWVDQFTAFDSVLSRFEAEGFSAYLRVHPNLATKAQECFVRERAGIRWLADRHPQLVVIWHDDAANSYSLLDTSDAVVVWDSTVGLEASARGLPVWTTATSRFGLVADIREVLSQEQLDSNGVTPWTVDPHQAKRFIAYLVLRDQDVTAGERWTAWDPAHQPRRATLAAIAVSGGIPGVGAAVTSLIDVYRHRRLRSNLRLLRR